MYCFFSQLEPTIGHKIVLSWFMGYPLVSAKRWVYCARPGEVSRFGLSSALLQSFTTGARWQQTIACWSRQDRRGSIINSKEFLTPFHQLQSRTCWNAAVFQITVDSGVGNLEVVEELFWWCLGAGLDMDPRRGINLLCWRFIKEKKKNGGQKQKNKHPILDVCHSILGKRSPKTHYYVGDFLSWASFYKWCHSWSFCKTGPAILVMHTD